LPLDDGHVAERVLRLMCTTKTRERVG